MGRFIEHVGLTPIPLLKRPHALSQYYRTVTFDALLGGGGWPDSPFACVTDMSTSGRRLGRFGCKTSNAIDAKERPVVKGVLDGRICEHYLIVFYVCNSVYLNTRWTKSRIQS